MTRLYSVIITTIIHPILAEVTPIEITLPEGAPWYAGIGIIMSLSLAWGIRRWMAAWADRISADAKAKNSHVEEKLQRLEIDRQNDKELFGLLNQMLENDRRRTDSFIAAITANNEAIANQTVSLERNSASIVQHGTTTESLRGAVTQLEGVVSGFPEVIQAQHNQQTGILQTVIQEILTTLSQSLEQLRLVSISNGIAPSVLETDAAIYGQSGGTPTADNPIIQPS